TSNGSLVARVSPPELAASVYWAPSLSMLRSANVATPFTASTPVVPYSVPPVGLLSTESVMRPAKLVTVFPALSKAATRTGGAIIPPTTAAVGCPTKARRRGVGGGGGGTDSTAKVTGNRPTGASDPMEVTTIVSTCSPVARPPGLRRTSRLDGIVSSVCPSWSHALPPTTEARHARPGDEPRTVRVRRFCAVLPSVTDSSILEGDTTSF